MPVKEGIIFKRPWYLPNGHLESIYPAVFRKVNGLPWQRQRLELADGDFLDIDWLRSGHGRLVVLSHGLEGESRRQYMAGMARLFFEHGWDVLAWNNRSCSGEMNRTPRMYHHGDIEDLGTVVQHGIASGDYEAVVLVGFSMGGNQTLKYLGVMGADVPAPVVGGVAFSAPTDLEAGAAILDRPENIIYKRRFLHYLSRKMRLKAKQFPGLIPVERLNQVKHWREFDEWFSAPLNGYRDAAHFYRESSAANFMAGTRVPVLLVQAANDPILPPACYPVELCARHRLIHLEITRYGGHVGFLQQGSRDAWSEWRALQFASNLAGQPAKSQLE